jgi:hypothetical protein
MPRDIQEPTLNQHGDEEHPAWGMIGASRVSTGPQGAVLFDSDIRHNHTVVVRISTAARRRDLNRDWRHAKQQFVEVEMSEAQWASFVSSMNVGDGVPCTIRRREDDWEVPGVPYEPRLRESMIEVQMAAIKAAEAVAEAFKAYQEHKTAANLRTLGYVIQNMPSNMSYAATSLNEHAENVVQRARADIEAMVVTKAAQLGLDPAELGGTAQLLAGEDES